MLEAGDITGLITMYVLYQILAADTGVSARPVKHYKHGSNAVMSIRFHPVKSNYFLAATANGVIQGCDVDTGASQCCATGERARAQAAYRDSD